MKQKRDLTQYALILYTIFIVFADNTLLFYLGTAVFGLCETIIIFKERKIKIDKFVLIYLAVIMFFALCVIMGATMFPSISIKRCIVMLMNLVMGSFVVRELIDEEKRRRFFEKYCIVALAFEIYVMISSGSRLFAGRLGEYAYSPIAFGGNYNANGVGIVLIYAFILCLGFYLEDRKKNRVVFMLVYIIGILMTGSRKAIVSTVFALISLPLINIYYKEKNAFVHILKMIGLGIIVGILLFFSLFKIPVLYYIAGYRIEAMLNIFGGTTVVVESSLDFRDQFIDCAKEVFRSSPIHGIGIDNFAQVNIIKGYYAHNNYWELLAGGGIVGFSLYYLLYVYLIIRLWRQRKSDKPDVRTFLVFMLLMILMDNYLVSYLQHICIFFLFITNAVVNSKPHEGRVRITI